MSSERIKNREKNIIKCPECGVDIDVNDILYHQVDEQLKEQYKNELNREKEKIKTQVAALDKEKQEIKLKKTKQADEVAKQVKDELKEKEVALKKKLTEDLEEEQSEALKLLRGELNTKSAKLKKLNKTSAELEKLKREKNELEDQLKAAAEKELNEKLLEEKQKIQKEESSKSELKLKELKKQLADQKKLTAEMQRKQEQGSMQTQGEVQELAIEEWLSEKFPLDLIEEIKKGERGADCMQIVNTRNHQKCGTIYYESKRTKVFNSTWIEKFKADIREKNADIGVLVTDVMPTDMERLGLKEGIWICSFDEFKSLCGVLRDSIIKLSSALIAQDNKGDKMGSLYDFLTSNEFRLQIEAIVEGFTQMKADLESEQRSMRSIWKKREKQIDKVLSNTSDMYGSIKGIAGNAVQSVALLELPFVKDEAED